MKRTVSPCSYVTRELYGCGYGIEEWMVRKMSHHAGDRRKLALRV